MTSYWETEREFFEAHVSPGNVGELVAAAQNMTSKAIDWNGDAEELTWTIDDGKVVISFPGGSKSVGWDGK
uniref:hypothetical protein n=1 Tax=Microbacterium proteolyticum TaxID=1572644 RepID=UPI0024177933|nr:hypothetical protein [Microbacterium proteolyticum]